MFNPVKELRKYYCAEDSDYASVIMNTGDKLMDIAAEYLQQYDYPDDEQSIIDVIVELSDVIVRIMREHDEVNE